MKNLQRFIIYTLAIFLLGACTNDDFAEIREAESHNAYIKMEVGDFKVSTDSREGSTEVASESESRISDVWVFQYGTDGRQLRAPQYVVISSPSGFVGVPVNLVTDVQSTIYVVANTGTAEWASGSNASRFATIDDLEAMDIPNNFAQEGTDISLPMCGKKAATVTDGATVVVNVIRMFAKLKIKVSIGEDNWKYKNINVFNIPNTCRIGERKSVSGEAASYPAATQWYSRGRGAQTTSTDEYDYIIYVPENIQGSIKSNRSVKEKKENAPRRALYVYVEIKYETGAKDNEFTVYPGANIISDYNIKRNNVYNIELNITEPERKPEKVPSANCIVVAPGDEAHFEPYYRVEQGGGFDIGTYLDESGDDPDKFIDHVMVIWQNANVIGNNSAGDKVYLLKEEYTDLGERRVTASHYNEATSAKTTEVTGSISKEPYITINKIVVKTQQQGNALVGAYNAAGEIIWSWHIWCTGIEPDNIGNALTYTTYDWDKDDIYYNDAANTWNPEHPRIPGYALMPCALGAMAIWPDATLPFNTNNPAAAIPTFGLLYQWGRKDPFPAPCYGVSTSYAQCSYDTGAVERMYDNSYRQVQLTSYSTSSYENYLFHAVTSTQTQTMHGSGKDIIKYTIAHPTQFMCGTKSSRYTSPWNDCWSQIEKPETYYSFGGDWLPVHNNRLWGGLDPSDDQSVMKSIQFVSGYKFYDNYGSEKSIFDPCPKGWRVAPADLWFEFTKTGRNPNRNNFPDDINIDRTKVNRVRNGGLTLYLQDWRQGPVSYFSLPGILRSDGEGWGAYSCGNYHSASVAGDNLINSLHLHYEPSDFNLVETQYFRFRSKSIAAPIRCVRDSK